MSNTPLDTSGDVKVSVASHLSNLPVIATDASTSNLIELSTGVILNTGTPSAAWARLVAVSKMDARIQKILNRMAVCETSYLVATLQCELKELARLSRFCGCTRMTPQPGLSMLVTRKNEMAKAIGRIKSTDRLPWVTQPA